MVSPSLPSGSGSSAFRTGALALGLAMATAAPYGCGVPDILLVGDDASSAGDGDGDDASVDAGSSDGASDASGDASADADSDAPASAASCPDATPAGFDGCCGSTPCLGTCNETTCTPCSGKCSVGDQCCVRGGGGTCHPIGAVCQ
jgi:hypothetical protein